MKQDLTQEFFGYILKKEQLQSFDEMFQKQISVLVASNPFPGFDTKSKNQIFYLVIDNTEWKNSEELIRITQNINNSYNKSINASSCKLTIYNKLYKAIRIYNHNPKELSEIIDLYKTYGIVFEKEQLVKPFISLIKIHKNFVLVKKQEDTYVSATDSNFYYLKIPHKLTTEEFEQIIFQAKNQGLYKNCDFAMAVIYSNNGISDFIRIYTDFCTLERQQEFQSYILKTIKTLTLK